MKKRTKTAAVPTAVLLALMVLAGCASFNNFLNPVHAISSSGEKKAAQWGSGKTVKIEDAEYQYADRPAVPAAPKKPVSPGNPPSKPQKPVEPTGKTTYHVQGTAYTVYWSNGEELRLALQKPLDTMSRENMQHQYDQYLQELNRYNADMSTYQDRVAKYQQSKTQYDKDIAKYEQENAAYQANLPKYRADVDVKIKAIQKSINPSAPENWVGYVEGKYLLYKGKAE